MDPVITVPEASVYLEDIILGPVEFDPHLIRSACVIPQDVLARVVEIDPILVSVT